MGLVVHCPQPGHRDMGVELGGGQGGMTEQFLDHPKVRTTFEEMCGGTVPESVRPDVGRTRDGGDGLMHDGAGLTRIEPTAPRAQE